MTRLQVRLTKEARRLRALAAEEGMSVAALLRRAVDLVLGQTVPDRPEERARRALGIVGRFTDTPDVARRHDEYLDEAYRG